MCLVDRYGETKLYSKSDTFKFELERIFVDINQLDCIGSNRNEIFVKKKGKKTCMEETGAAYFDIIRKH